MALVEGVEWGLSDGVVGYAGGVSELVSQQGYAVVRRDALAEVVVC